MLSFNFATRREQVRGLPSLKRKKGPGPGPLRVMNARTAATGHKSLSVLPMKISAPTLKVLDAIIRTRMTWGFAVQSTEISLNVR